MGLETLIPLEGIKPGELVLASINYIDALRLPQNGPVLVVTDKLIADSDPDANARRWMAKQMYHLLNSEGRNVSLLQFDETTPRNEMSQATASALHVLKPDTPSLTPMTIVYIGKRWENRSGFYDAVAAFEKESQIKTRLAISVGLNRADIKTLLKIKPDNQKAIATEVEKALQFFQNHPQGSFEITTRHGENTYKLNLNYDTSQSPFHPDWGVLNDDFPSPMDRKEYGVISNAGNIPGGEVFATPLPFSQTQGQFVASEVLFTVQYGLITDAQSLTGKPPEGEDLISIVHEIQSGHLLPVSELGLGMFALAGIKSEQGSSVLASEKDGPHIGVGTVPGESTEIEAISALAGEFHHGDLVLDDPIINFRETDDDQPIQFYPPKNNLNLPG